MPNFVESQRISLRPVDNNDEEFLFALYAATRREEVTMFGWDLAQQDAFLEMQFSIRQRVYRRQYPDADDNLILLDKKPVGRAIVDRSGASILLVDIAILPEYRGNGIGTFWITQLQNEVGKNDKSVFLEVEKTNVIARRLYKKMGFIVVDGTEDGETDLHERMKWEKKIQ